MIEIKLPFWLSASETKKLSAAAKVWWERVEEWAGWPLSQLDAMTCTVAMLNLLAWQRDVDRFADEPLSLYRLRVKYALINAQDSGSKAGFIAIFQRLGIGYVEIEERTDAINWDVILLKLSDSQLSENTDLLMNIIHKYGRTCRRYQLDVITPIGLTVDAREVGHTWWFDTAIQKVAPWYADATLDNKETGNSWNLDIASI